MAQVERANVVLTVDDDDIDFYVAKGYSLVENGKVIRKAVPTDLGELQKYFMDSKEQIAELEEQIAKLTAENIKLKKSIRKG